MTIASSVRISSLSTQYVSVGPIRIRENGVVVDPTASGVELAFVPAGSEPEEDEWAAGSWETDSTSGEARYYAKVLVGPNGGAVDPGDGTWDVWARIDRSPEEIVSEAQGRVVIS